ncbi:sn-glycerol-3-phosphate ABC transporter ATP-binding protein UgpC [Alsobacter sp. SYSU M60028]|uniref:Sn-glycerol-3-phosphate ABC transporter ATP-binding protein UgpC n=1 Tax=Alsobacter ponti TaxID=2962936 RepID=A0ABT1LDT1_9HYPH|nr:sn-glycerol-3-phosphate ABC transporter ATP-binding protein UgpC [Alsobacter ponti]MCP8939657.1 sn-glycerol-3-phosphate ABC transporter ATP-binding protein UgpC [Alsobacter ponti]
MTSIVLKRVSKKFGTTSVISDLSLAIDPGEFTVFLGPSGCGKSTLLRMIAGLEDVTSGEIEIEGQRIDRAPPGERGVAMVFQNYALYPHMSVRENLSFGLKNIGMPKAQIDERVQAAARMLEMDALLERRPSQLSGGQRQRVAIGRAIVKEPRAFLFDEPLSNLDAALRSRTRVELSRLHQRMKATMIFVTHDQVEAMTMATRIVVMNQGRVEQVGTPLGIYRRPATRFVAGFIGSPAMNFLKVEPAAGEGGMAAVRLGDGTVVQTDIPTAGLEAVPAELGVRAEHVTTGGGIPATVDVVERLGDRTLVYSRLRNGAAVVYEDEGDSPVSVGDAVSLGFRRQFLHLFDASGKAHQAPTLEGGPRHG